MPVLKNDAMLKTLNAINDHQFAQWKTYAADPKDAAELEGEVAVLGSLFNELSGMIDDVQIYEHGANKQVYAQFVNLLSTKYNAANDYGYFSPDDTESEDRMEGFRKGVQCVEQELAKMVLDVVVTNHDCPSCSS